MFALMVVGLMVLFGSGLVTAATEPPQVVFAGGQGRIRTILHNSADTAVEHNLVARGAMMASSVAAPLPGVQGPETVKIPAGQSAIVSWRVDIPAVRTVTRFALTVSAPDNRPLGHWTFFAVPRDLPAQMASLIGGKAIVQTGLEELQSALAAAGIPPGSLDSPPLDLGTAILGPWKTAAPRQLRERIRALGERGVTCIVLGGDIAAMPRMLSHRIAKGVVISVSGVEFQGFAENAAAQLALWEACRMARAPEELPAWIKN